MITKNYCMKTNKQMKINNTKNITTFKLYVLAGYTHSFMHTHTQSPKDANILLLKDLSQNVTK